MNLSGKSNFHLLSILVGKSLAKNLAKRPLLEVFGYEKPRQFSLGESEPASYGITPVLAAAKELVSRALSEELKNDAIAMDSPSKMRSFLRDKLLGLEHEVFYVVYLDAQYRVIAEEQLFRGSLTQASVYPREVVKQALHFNCAAVIISHNHPSGVQTPSNQDLNLTQILKKTLQLVDVRLLDHVIVASSGCHSMAENGQI